MLPVMYANAAGIDIGAEEIFLAVPADRADDPVREVCLSVDGAILECPPRELLGELHAEVERSQLSRKIFTYGNRSVQAFAAAVHVYPAISCHRPR